MKLGLISAASLVSTFDWFIQSSDYYPLFTWLVEDFTLKITVTNAFDDFVIDSC